MATPTLTRHVLPGTLGDILVDVRAGGRGSARPAVIVLHGFKGFKDWGMFPRSPIAWPAPGYRRHAQPERKRRGR